MVYTPDSSLARWKLLARADVLVGSAVSLVLIIGSWCHWLPLGLTEVFGFVTGGICVWLTVKENVWNWPLGIANDIFFVFLFLSSRLYADMTLQVVYIILGLLGWYWWLYGGEQHKELRVGTADTVTLAIVAVLVVISTVGMTVFLTHVKDSAPFWDALTTTLSLAAQYLLTRKLIENWYLWIMADLIYVPLYASKHLFLTAILYALFLCMCLAGLSQWRRTWLAQRDVALAIS
ncbi:MAG: nicotinamide mononucleotide transporter [Abitibacteriaceae bacterium]|nr:nicotinamide mononucleotide transporter [Abditibacteriaceae bacterium]